MSYSDLVRAFFERSTALQGYWTLYVIVIGGLLGLSSLRQRKSLATTALVMILYSCFAYKNLGAIEDTLAERRALLTAINAYPASADVQRVRDALEPTLPQSEPWGVHYFHLACDLMTLAALGLKEWQRRQSSAVSGQLSAVSEDS